MKNILSILPDDIRLSQINFFGTHDSMTAFVSMEKAARCQSLTLSQQLELGVRLLDIRLSRKKDEFYLVHSLADCYKDERKKERLLFGDVLSECEKFLRDNPDETLILSIKQDRGIQSKRFFPAFFKKYIEGNEKLWYLSNQIPALSECRGKMVLMRRCYIRKSYDKKELAGLDFSLWEDQSGTRKVEPLPVILNENEKAMVQDRYSLNVRRKWYDSAKSFLDACTVDESNIALHFLSTSYHYKNEGLERTAAEMNELFKAYDLKNRKGWFFTDFPDEELAEKITESNLKEKN